MLQAIQLACDPGTRYEIGATMVAVEVVAASKK
jgi:hypothetical protein